MLCRNLRDLDGPAVVFRSAEAVIHQSEGSASCSGRKCKSQGLHEADGLFCHTYLKLMSCNVRLSEHMDRNVFEKRRIEDRSEKLGLTVVSVLVAWGNI